MHYPYLGMLRRGIYFPISFYIESGFEVNGKAPEPHIIPFLFRKQLYSTRAFLCFKRTAFLTAKLELWPCLIDIISGESLLPAALSSCCGSLRPNGRVHADKKPAPFQGPPMPDLRWYLPPHKSQRQALITKLGVDYIMHNIVIDAESDAMS